MNISDMRCTPEGLHAAIEKTVGAVGDAVSQEMERRAHLVANELHTASQYVLRGQRSGRWYQVPGTYRKRKSVKEVMVNNGHTTGRWYQASAPGEPPAIRLDNFRPSWVPRAYVDGRSANGETLVSVCESDYHVNGRHLGTLLEYGHGRVAPRPYVMKTIQRALPKIQRIYERPF